MQTVVIVKIVAPPPGMLERVREGLVCRVPVPLDTRELLEFGFHIFHNLGQRAVLGLQGVFVAERQPVNSEAGVLETLAAGVRVGDHARNPTLYVVLVDLLDQPTR